MSVVTRKKTKKYYISVEGETERWYFEWLENIINKTDESQYNVSFHCVVEKNPLKCAKNLSITQRTEVFHISDYESHDEAHEKIFLDTMNKMNQTKRLGKQITYRFGYSNLTFDLWIILHKIDCNRCINHRSEYYKYINRAYSEKFECMDDYKHEKNFQRCLDKLQLADVIKAVERAKNIMRRNEENGYTLYQYKGYKYYKENPSLTIWEVVEKVLKKCRLF